MEYSVIATPPSIIIAFTLFILILVVYWIAIKISGNKKNNEHGTEELGAVEGSLLGLLALLLAFTFNMAVTRFDMRRQVLIEEANNIGTAILRADLYPDSVRNLFRADFKDYVEARIAYYDAKTNQEKIKIALDQANTISTKLWNRAALLGQNRDNFISSTQMVPALNSMIDIVTTRNAVKNAKVPDSIMWFLFVLCLICSFLIGYKGKKNKLAYVVAIVFSLMVSTSIYFVLDLDKPRRGLINIDSSEQYMIDLRKMF